MWFNEPNLLIQNFVFGTKIIYIVFFFDIPQNQSEVMLLANDDSRKLTSGKYGNFEFFSWADIGNGRIAVGGRNQILVFEPNNDGILEELNPVTLNPDATTRTNCQRSGYTVNIRISKLEKSLENIVKIF